MSHWRETSEWVISEALQAAKAQGLDERATRKLVDSRYPFGTRSNHPYTMWLKVRKKMLRPANLIQIQNVSEFWTRERD